MLTLTFTTDNSAFDEDPANESARILRHLADALDSGKREGAVIDTNGNRVGTWALNAD